MRTSVNIALWIGGAAIIGILGGGAWFLWQRPSPVPEYASHWDRPRVEPETVRDAELVGGDEEVVPVPVDMEQAVTRPVPYFPPPSVDLTGGRLGNQVVLATDGIGDIFKIYFHDATQALYMAVVEPTGMRAIWRLTESGSAERVMALNDKPGEVQIDGDRKGVMYVQHDNPSALYRTADAFVSWRTVLEGKGMFWSIADNGKGTVFGSLHEYNSAILYHSPDDGFSWEPLTDFQKVLPEDAVQYASEDPRLRLRHLHDVIYSEKSDALIVGTGDVARYAMRSDDGGKSWRKVWNEGFTASLPLGGGNRYLLCPDSLHKHPLAVYDVWADKITPVWNPKDHGYAGYCYSLANVDGVYYAAFHTEANEVETVIPKSGIIASPDGFTWYPFLEWAPLGNHARTNIWLASAPNRVYASVNGRLYAFKPLDKAWFAGKEPFTAQ